jgi:hypothetical protein
VLSMRFSSRNSFRSRTAVRPFHARAIAAIERRDDPKCEASKDALDRILSDWSMSENPDLGRCDI